MLGLCIMNLPTSASRWTIPSASRVKRAKVVFFNGCPLATSGAQWVSRWGEKKSHVLGLKAWGVQVLRFF